MSKLKFKVCGMKYPDNITGLIQHAPNFIGFIFYKKSARFADPLDKALVNTIPSDIHKVGVFVNEEITGVHEKIRAYQLDYVQLHGDESLEYIQNLKAVDPDIKVIKVFRVVDKLPPEIYSYEGHVALFLFDTATSQYGGSGKHFDWNFLKNYDLETPYLLSGGIDLEDIDTIEQMDFPGLIGIDVNSKFEISPAKKNLEMIGQLKELI